VFLNQHRELILNQQWGNGIDLTAMQNTLLASVRDGSPQHESAGEWRDEAATQSTPFSDGRDRELTVAGDNRSTKNRRGSLSRLAPMP